MKYMNLLEKLVNLFTITGKSWVNLGFLTFFVIILLLLCMKKISKKMGFILSLVGDVSLIIYTIVINYDNVSKLFDDIMNHLFVNIYFPSIYVYLFVLLFINVVTIGSLININKKGIFKTVNGICFLVTNFVLALILDILSKNEIDVFSKSSLFSNKDLIILLELSVSIFMIWLLSLGVIYLTNVISERILLRGEKNVKVKKVNLDNVTNLEVSLEGIENTYRDDNQDTLNNLGNEIVVSVMEGIGGENKFIPSLENTTNSTVLNKQLMIEEALSKQNQVQSDVIQSFISVDNSSSFIKEDEVLEQDYVSAILNENQMDNSNESFDLSSFVPRKQDNRVIYERDTSKIFEQILNNKLPLMEESKEVVNEYEAEKNTYTLNDYRIFNKMLKDIKEHNQSNTIDIDKMLEYRLITKYSSETYDLFKRMLKNYSN